MFDLVGMNLILSGGLGEIVNFDLLVFMVCYCFYFYLVCWISFGLVVIEVMMVGLLVVGLVIIELVNVICNDRNGYIDIDL